MEGTYITDYITSSEELAQAYEAMFEGSKFCCSTGNSFYSEGKGVITEDFYIGNFVTRNIESIQAININKCVISIPYKGYYDTTVKSRTVKNKAKDTGTLICKVDEVRYHNTGEFVNAYDLYIHSKELLNLLNQKFGIQSFENYFNEIKLSNDKVKALFYYIDSTINLVETFESVRDSLVARMNIKEISLLMVTDLIGDLLHKSSVLNESTDKKLVILAEEIMESQCEDLTTIQEIADKVYTSPRNLQKVFKKYRDYSPLHFLKERKLIRANCILKDPYSDSNIKNVAIHVGMFDLNRFSKYYYNKFGEYPSETINNKYKV